MGEDTVRCWLVERSYDDKGLITLAYATPDGERQFRSEQAAVTVDTVTAATAVETDRLEPVDDSETRERYASEVDRMRERHDPDDEV